MWYHLLPYIEQKAIFDQGTPANPFVSSDGYKFKTAVLEVAPNIVKAFLCPADGTHGAHLADPSENGAQGAVTTPQGVQLKYSTGSYVGNVMVFDPSIPRTILTGMTDGSSNTAVIGHRLERCDPRTVWGVTFDVYNYMFAEPRNFSPYRPIAVFGMPTYAATYGTVSTSCTGAAMSTPGSNPTPRNCNGVRNQNQDFVSGGLPFQIKPRPGLCQPFVMATSHEVMLVGLGDASVRSVSSSVSAATWKNAWTPADGNPLGNDW